MEAHTGDQGILSLTGGQRLHGSVWVRGAKNSVLKLMAAALLAPGTSTLTNVPAIVDVEIMAELLRRLGCTVTWDTSAGVVEIDVPERLDHRADLGEARLARGRARLGRVLLAALGDRHELGARDLLLDGVHVHLRERGRARAPQQSKHIGEREAESEQTEAASRTMHS